MIFARIKKTIPTLGLILSGLFAVLSANAGLAQVMLQDIEFVSLSGSEVTLVERAASAPAAKGMLVDAVVELLVDDRAHVRERERVQEGDQ